MSGLKETLQNLGGKVSVTLIPKKPPVRALEADTTDGYLGEKFASGLRIAIELELPNGHPLTIFRVEKVNEDKKHCVPFPICHHANESTLHYLRIVDIRHVRSGYTAPDKFRNCLWVLVPGERGAFRVGRVEIVAQDGKFFLSEEFLYEGECYRDHHDVAVPRFTTCPELHYKEWPSLTALLAARFQNERLHWLRDYVQPIKLDDFGLAPGQGRVIWWSPTSYGGFGCVATPQGNAHVYWLKIVSGERYRRLTPGALVTVDELLPTPPEIKSDFPFTAIGVHPVVVDVIAANAIAEIDPILALIGDAP